MDIPEFEQIYHRSFNVLCNKVYRMINDADAAKDIVQNVFLRLWNRKDTLIINITPDAYLYKAVINESLNYLDSKKRTPLIRSDNEAMQVDSGQTIQEEMHFSELEEKVNLLLSQLPPKCRKVFMLSRFENMSYKEIAQFLEISENTVDNHIKKALLLFRKALIKFVLIFH